MAWIKSHDEIWEHHKTIKLCRLVSINKAQAVGHLHGLWHFVLRNAWRNANLEPWGDIEIERACFWEGEKGALVKGLREAGFLDGFVVHDWIKTASSLVVERLYNERRRKNAVKTPQKRRKDAVKSQPEESRVEESRVETTTIAQSLAAQATAPEPGIYFPVVGNGSKEWILNLSKLKEYKQVYTVDLETEIPKAKQWLIDNPTRRKTAKGMPRFINSWLARAQNGR